MVSLARITDLEGKISVQARFTEGKGGRVSTVLSGTDEGLEALYFYMFYEGDFSNALAVTIGYPRPIPNSLDCVLSIMRVASEDLGYKFTEGEADEA